MQKLLARTVICSKLLLVGINSVYAQYYPDRDRPVYRDSHNNGFGDYRGAFYDRLESHLSRAANNGYLRGGDLRRFQQASEEIREFQAKWARGRYDRHELDDAIGATQRVANLRGLDYRDRAIINEDLTRMRDFRARMNDNRSYGNDRYYGPR